MDRFHAGKQHVYQTRTFLTDRAISPSGSNWFRMESLHSPTLKELIAAQMEYGFDPRGYGGPSNIETEHPFKLFITTWSCAGSSD